MRVLTIVLTATAAFGFAAAQAVAQDTPAGPQSQSGQTQPGATDSDKGDDAKGSGAVGKGAAGKDTGEKDAGKNNTGKADQPGRLTYPYEVTLSGISDETIDKTAKELSVLFQEKSRPPATRLGLRRRRQADAEKLRAYLRSEGYYAARLSITTDHKVKPAKVAIKVDLGERYTLTVFRILDQQGNALPAAPPLSAIGVTLGEPGRSATIVAAQTRVLAFLATRGYPFAEVARRQVIVDHKPKDVEVTLYINSGGLTRFGATRVVGLKRAKEDFVRKKIAWKQGEIFDARKVRQTRRNLLDTGVFSSILIAPQEKERGANGEAPILMTLGERKPRTIEAGVNYSTDEGPGGNLSWIHRNLFGRGERLRLTVNSSLSERLAFAQLTFPTIFDGPQKLLLTTRFVENQYDAYDEITFGTSAIIDRRINRHVNVSGGVSFERSLITETGVQERYTLFGLPTTFRFDDTDNLLNPTKGIRVNLELTPYQGRGPSGGLLFAQIIGKVRGYWKPWTDRNTVLAGWFQLGTVLGEESRNIPANKRLYAGGGGSVRGFGYQRISPLDSNNDPIGGRSLIAFGTELRFRISGDWGGVLFVEGASVSESRLPNFSQPVRWGAGIGLRYYTSFGPVRLDLGFPINRRKGDPVLQFYISIGQAF